MWQPVIGLEVHVQLATQSKIFSRTSTRFGQLPNTQVSFIDAALPGTLPMLNAQVMEYAVRFGLAIGADLARYGIFERKNYYYPDLPKGYQITQMATPIVRGGALTVYVPKGRDWEKKIVRISHAHIEEDAGRLLHDVFPHHTAVDLNRAGTPLIEVVSYPDLLSVQEAVAYARELHALVRWLGICDGNMQEGSFRVDANVSVRRHDTNVLGTRCEIKNINSFRFLEKAIAYEIQRHIRLLETGATVRQETRLYDANRNETRFMRIKEDARDYCYCPDPDLPPFVLSDALVSRIQASMPVLPAQWRQKFFEQYRLPWSIVLLLTHSRAMANFFEQTVLAFPTDPLLCARWICGELMAYLNAQHLSIEESAISATQLADLLRHLHEKRITQRTAKDLFKKVVMASGTQTVDEMVWACVAPATDSVLPVHDWVASAIAGHPKVVAQYRSGKEKALNVLIGAVMNQSSGQANPDEVKKVLVEQLKS